MKIFKKGFRNKSFFVNYCKIIPYFARKIEMYVIIKVGDITYERKNREFCSNDRKLL